MRLFAASEWATARAPSVEATTPAATISSVSAIHAPRCVRMCVRMRVAGAFGAAAAAPVGEGV